MVKICGYGESQVEDKLLDLIDKQKNPTIATYAKTGEVHIRVTAKAATEEEARKRVEKYSSIERVKSNVDKTVGDRIREYDLAGVKVDEDYKRYYPYGDLASKVLGFTGGDNQGIIGLEVKYDKYLKGVDGKILTTTDARGIELYAEIEIPDDVDDEFYGYDELKKEILAQAIDKEIDIKQLNFWLD